MRDSKPVEHNLENLRIVSKKLADIPHFVFFGTLLGYVREKSIITGDDDIDLYVDRRFKDEVTEIFSDTDFVFKTSTERYRTVYFSQASRMIDGEKTFIDFYFYENNDELDYIVENWNFHGKYKKIRTSLHIPKSIIYPLKTGTMKGFEVSLPSDAEACCAYLYGEDWRVPKAKGAEYKMEVVKHRPKLVAVES